MSLNPSILLLASGADVNVDFDLSFIAQIALSLRREDVGPAVRAYIADL